MRKLTKNEMRILSKKIDFILLFECVLGNPNGDKDAANAPRIILETGHGIVTDVALKRKQRNYVDIRHGGEEGNAIFIKHGIPKDFEQNNALKEIPRPEKTNGFLDKLAYAEKLKSWMCHKFWDVRTFGAVCQRFTEKTTKGGGGVDGAICGPVQLGFAESVSKIDIQRISINCCAVANEKEAESKENTIGTKYIIPYGLYKCVGHISPHLAERTGFTEADLALLWESFLHMFETDHAAGRGHMALRKLIVFEHEDKWGTAFEEDIANAVKIKEKTDIPRRFEDYEVTIEPVKGTKIIELK